MRRFPYYERQTLRPIDVPLRWNPEWETDIECNADAWGNQGSLNAAVVTEDQTWPEFIFEMPIEELHAIVVKQVTKWHKANPNAGKLVKWSNMTLRQQKWLKEQEEREENIKWFRAIYGNRFM